LKTLHEFLEKEVEAPLSKIFDALALAAIQVWHEIPTASEFAAGVNPSGDLQTKIDLFANEKFVDAILNTGQAAAVASEELDKPRIGSGRLWIAVDPLDGSSNILTNNPLGSIFAIYDQELPCSGKNLVAAGYVTYGPMLTLTLSASKGVDRFTAMWNGERHVFRQTQSDIRLPNKFEVYGIGGLRKDWTEPVERFVRDLEQRGMKLRYGGTFVGDYNQVLQYGGIFGYPALKNKPGGKLRLLYEVHPMAFVMKHAGGASSTGIHDLLDVKPVELAGTSPAFLGNRELIENLERVMTT
jgi:fructose-1,6-bisphosphatase I